jgi:putative PEP-CTERM system TPR-repeat lipoprotein
MSARLANMKKKGFYQSKLVVAIAMASTLALSGCGEKTSEEHILAARQYVQADDKQAAIVEYKNAIQLAPRVAETRFELGEIYVQVEDFASAEKELNRALELGYDGAKVLPLLTLSYQQTGAKTALAKVDYSIDGLNDVERAEIGFYKLQALIELEKNTEARELIAELASLDTTSVYAGLIDVLDSLLNKQLNLAEVALAQLAAQAPLNKDVLLLQARVFLMQKKRDEAVDVYQKYVKTYPKDVERKFILTALLMDLQRLDEAEPLVDELLAINGIHPLLNQFKGVILAAEDKPKEALDHLEIAIQNGRVDPVARLVAGFSAYKVADYDAVIRHLSIIAGDLPRSHPALRMLADSLLRTGQNAEASDILSRVQGSYTGDAALFSKAGYQLMRSGKLEDAKAMVERSASISTTSQDLTRLGVLQLSLNDVDGLINLEQAVEKAPESDISQQMLATAYLTAKDYQKASEAVANWISIQPDNIEAHLFAAEIALQQKDFMAADEAIKIAEDLAPTSEVVKLQRVNYYLNQQEFDKATNQLDEVLTINPTSTRAWTIYYVLAEQQGTEVEAAKKVSAALTQYPKEIGLRLLLARIYLFQKDIAAGLATMSGISVDENTPFAYWPIMSQLLLRNNQVSDAEQINDEWLARYPNNRAAIMERFLIFDLRAKYQDALTLATEYLQQRDDRQVLMLKAYFHSMLQQIRETRAVLAQLTDEELYQPLVRATKARIALFAKQADKALPDALAAYNNSRTTPNLVLLMAAYEGTGQEDKALAVASDFVKYNPNSVTANMLLAERLISVDRERAKGLYEKVIAQAPDNFIVLNNLAYLEMEDGNYKKAEAAARDAIKIKPSSAESVDTLAQILIAKNELEDAREVYESLTNEDIQSDEIYLNYIELLYKLDLAPLAQRRLSSRRFSSAEAQLRIRSMKAKYEP